MLHRPPDDLPDEWGAVLPLMLLEMQRPMQQFCVVLFRSFPKVFRLSLKEFALDAVHPLALLEMQPPTLQFYVALSLPFPKVFHSSSKEFAAEPMVHLFQGFAGDQLLDRLASVHPLVFLSEMQRPAQQFCAVLFLSFPWVFRWSSKEFAPESMIHHFQGLEDG
jgi:hypothetical protein